MNGTRQSSAWLVPVALHGHGWPQLKARILRTPQLSSASRQCIFFRARDVVTPKPKPGEDYSEGPSCTKIHEYSTHGSL